MSLSLKNHILLGDLVCHFPDCQVRIINLGVIPDYKAVNSCMDSDCRPKIKMMINWGDHQHGAQQPR